MQLCISLIFPTSLDVYKRQVSQLLRGYFQGTKKMIPTAVSQAGEQIFRVAFGLIGVYLLMPLGLEYAICGIAGGIVCGEIIGFLILLLYNRFHLRKTNPYRASQPINLNRQIKIEMVALSLPLVLLRISGSVTHVLDVYKRQLLYHTAAHSQYTMRTFFLPGYQFA